jgi:hypothetical protein
LPVRHVIGVGLGWPGEPTVIVVVEGEIFREHKGVSMFYNGRIVHEGGFLMPDGTFQDEHPPVVFSLRHAERMSPAASYPQMIARVKEIASPLDEPTVALEGTSVGYSAVELFQRAGLHPYAIMVTGGDAVGGEGGFLHVPRKEIVSATQALLQTDRVRIGRDVPLAGELLRELQTFRMEPPGVSVQGSGGQQERLALTLAMALWVAKDRIHAPLNYPVIIHRRRRWRSRG